MKVKMKEIKRGKEFKGSLSRSRVIVMIDEYEGGRMVKRI